MTQAAVVTIVLLTVTLLTAMSLRANRRFEASPQLPMQWLGEQVTWSAPRKVALAFTPALAAVCLGAVLALTLFKAPRAGQEGLVIPITLIIALTFLGAHAFHLRLIQRTLQRRR